MKTYFQLAEELTPAQKAEVNSWGSNEAATRISKGVFPEGHDRIEVPLERPHTSPEDSLHYKEVKAHLEANGHTIKDYKAGLATDKHGRDVKIGKALEKTKAPDHLKMNYANDPIRAASTQKDNLKVIISKHPHDVDVRKAASRHVLADDTQHIAYISHPEFHTWAKYHYPKHDHDHDHFYDLMMKHGGDAARTMMATRYDLPAKHLIALTQDRHPTVAEIAKQNAKLRNISYPGQGTTEA